MPNAYEIADKLCARPIADRLYFYAFFAHELTIDVRAVWSDPERSSESQVAAMKRINELQHRVLGKLLSLQRGDESWSDRDFVDGIQKIIADSEIRGEVGRAFKTAWLRLERA